MGLSIITLWIKFLRYRPCHISTFISLVCEKELLPKISDVDIENLTVFVDKAKEQGRCAMSFTLAQTLKKI